MNQIERIQAEGPSDEDVETMIEALKDCNRVLLESGQLEVNPPKSLVKMFTEEKYLVEDEE